LNTDYIKSKISSIPENPGIYKFLGNEGELLYIGKAKNLKKRVSSYFSNTSSLNKKIQVLVRKIHDIDYIIVDSEHDALLLENNLIKEYQPRYNVLLKDDKTFPWICIKNERFPRVFITRYIEKDNSEYYGPYTSVMMAKTLIDLIKKLYPLRTCSYNLSEENIKKKKFKVCLEFHIKNCKGPCENFQSIEEYNENINHIRSIIKGNLTSIIEHLKDLMKKYAENYQFENAEIVKQKIHILEKYKSKSTIVNPDITNVDVFSIAADDKIACVNYFKVINGAIIQSSNINLIKKLDESNEDLLIMSILSVIQKQNSVPEEIIIPFEISSLQNVTKLVVPKNGDKKKLLDLSLRNALTLLKDKQRLRNNEKLPKTKTILEKLQYDLKLNLYPEHIECFDNSNIQGSVPVASCVVFKNGKPRPSEYRHYNIKTVKGANDYASMEEIVFRRYKRVLEEKKEIPHLIIIDGGKGQLNAALKSIRALKIEDKTNIIAIAKRLEEIFFPNDPFPAYLNKNSSSLRLIQHIRNEAHRFGISFHKLKRTKQMTNSILDNIPGIGLKTKEKLLNHFEDIEVIKKSDKTTLISLLGKKLGEIVYSYFNPD
jgi:excinuclease ABC subunit C